MPVKVILLAALCRLCDGNREVMVDGETVRELIRNLQDRFPSLRARLLDEKGEIRRVIRIFKNGDDTNFLRGGDTPVEHGDEIELVPAVIGG